MSWIEGGWGDQFGWAPRLLVLVWALLFAAAVWAIARLTRSGRRRLDARYSPQSDPNRRSVAREIDAQHHAQSVRGLDGRRIASAPGQPIERRSGAATMDHEVSMKTP